LSELVATRELNFVVFHEPVGAPRMTQQDKWKKRPCVTRYRDFKDAIRKVSGAMPDSSKVMSLSWVAFFTPPESWSKKRRAAAMGELHRSKPDLDNIAKGVFDALFTDDSGIAKGTFEKRWGDQSRLEVTIIYRTE